MSLSPIFGPSLNPRVQSFAEKYNRYESHTKNCPSCSNTLQFAKNIKTYNKYISLILFALFKRPSLKLLSVLFFFTTDFISDKLYRAMMGPKQGLSIMIILLLLIF